MTNLAIVASGKQTDTMSLIRGWIKDPPENSRVLTFTPKVAAEILGLQPDGDGVGMNTHNRARKPAKIKEYADDMADGEWKLTGDTIKFTVSGAVGDGQNRLLGCVKAKKPFRTHVVFGIDDAVFPWLDKGKPRSLGDDFFVDAVENPQLLAHVMRWVELFRLGQVKERTTFSRTELRTAYFDGGYDKELLAVAMARGLGVQKAMEIKTPRAFAAALYYLFATKNKVLADQFFGAWSTGTHPKGLGSIGKALTYLQKSKREGVRIHDTMRAFVWVTAWNLAVKKQTGTLGKFAYSEKDAFPKIMG